MNIRNIQHRTQTLYAVIHALEIAKSIHFGNLEFIPESLENSREWIVPECSFTSCIPDAPKASKAPKIRTNPERDFARIAETLVAMFIQDFVNHLDSLMTEVLLSRGLVAGKYPQSKVEKLAVGLEPKYLWSTNGCLELIAVRNALVHNNGIWNKPSVDIVKNIVSPIPKVGDPIKIGLPMLFKYRKAVRTFINESKKNP